jgi:hypothetical protein
MWIRTFDYLLAVAGLVGHLTLLTVLVRRHLAGRLPIFATVIAFYLLCSVMLLVPHFPATKPASYWLLIYLDPGLQILLIITLGFVAWRNTADVKHGRILLLLAIPAFAAIAAFTAWNIGISSHYSLQNLAAKLSLFVSALWLQVAGLFVFQRRGDWQTKRPFLAITLGFAAYSAANIAAEVTRMHVLPLTHSTDLYARISFFWAIVYLGCLAGWSILFLRDRSNNPSRPTALAASGW